MVITSLIAFHHLLSGCEYIICKETNLIRKKNKSTKICRKSQLINLCASIPMYIHVLGTLAYLYMSLHQVYYVCLQASSLSLSIYQACKVSKGYIVPSSFVLSPPISVGNLPHFQSLSVSSRLSEYLWPSLTRTVSASPINVDVMYCRYRLRACSTSKQNQRQ